MRHPQRCQTKSRSRLGVSFVAVATLATAFYCPAVAAAETKTKTFVISWFLQATNSYDGDCPAGINPLPADLFEIELKGLGWTPEEINKVMAGYQGGASTAATRQALVMRGRVDGKPVNVYTYPTSVPD